MFLSHYHIGLGCSEWYMKSIWLETLNDLLLVREEDGNEHTFTWIFKNKKWIIKKKSAVVTYHPYQQYFIIELLITDVLWLRTSRHETSMNFQCLRKKYSKFTGLMYLLWHQLKIKWGPAKRMLNININHWSFTSLNVFTFKLRC